MNASQTPDNQSTVPPNGVHQQPSGDSHAPTHPDFRRRIWSLAIGVGIFCGLVPGVVRWFAQRSQYTASSMIRVSRQPESIVFEPKRRETLREFDIYKKTQLQLLRSPLVLTAALRKPRISSLSIVKREEDPITWLQEKLEVSFPEDSEIVEVSLTDYHPSGVQAIVNAVVGAYLTDIVQVEENLRRRRLGELERVYTDKEDETRQKWAALKGLTEQLGIADRDGLSVRQQLAIQQFSALIKELLGLRTDVWRAEAELTAQKALFEAGATAEISQLELDTYLHSDPAAREMLFELSRLERQLAELESITVPPAATQKAERHKGNVKLVQQQFELRKKELEEQVRRRNRAKIQAEITRLEVQTAVLSKKQEQLEDEVQIQLEDIEQTSIISVDVEMMRAELEPLENALATIAEEREKLKVELRSGSRIRLVQPADEPESPEFPPGWGRCTLLTMAGGFCIPFFGILLSVVFVRWVNARLA